MQMHKDTPAILFKSPDQWENWLSKNYDKLPAIWMKIAKKNTGAVSISYDEALTIALCFGWIDGLINKYDEKYYLTRFTPRKKTSVWSSSNRLLADKLKADGRMHPSGIKIIEQAKINGSWYNAYDGSRDMQVPDDFMKELAKDKKAEAFFLSLNRANTYAIAWRIQTARKPETRRQRIETILSMLSKGEKLH